MKTLTKRIGIILILVLTVLSVEAQETQDKNFTPVEYSLNDYSEYKMFYTKFWVKDVYSEFEEDYEVTIKGLNGEELLLNTLRLSFYFAESTNKKDYIVFQMQTLDSKKLGKEEWYEELIYVYRGVVDYDNELLGEKTTDILARRKNGEKFVYTFKLGVDTKYIHFINEKEKTEIAISYKLVK